MPPMPHALHPRTPCPERRRSILWPPPIAANARTSSHRPRSIRTRRVRSSAHIAPQQEPVSALSVRAKAGCGGKCELSKSQLKTLIAMRPAERAKTARAADRSLPARSRGPRWTTSRRAGSLVPTHHSAAAGAGPGAAASLGFVVVAASSGFVVMAFLNSSKSIWSSPFLSAKLIMS